MPHKDRGARLAYLRAWKERKRPSPAPEPQPDPSLPSRGVIAFSVDGTKVQCHACGRWYGSLNTHFKVHGLDGATYKEMFGLPRTASMLPPVTQDRYRQAALDRDQGAIGRANIPPAKGRPVGQTPRLGVRIEASKARAGIYTRGGNKTGSTQ